MNLPDIVKNKLISLGASLEDSFLVAVSGGADSTALLLALRAALGGTGKLAVAHLDHAVRPESRQNLERVTELCNKLGVKSVTGQLNTDEIEAYRRSYGSLEASMRFLRYRFMFEAAEKTGTKWIVTGHTADDQAETVLFRVTRGMDWRSLGGIPEKRGIILRPLMDVSRSATRGYCKTMGISPVTDPSNYDEAFARNRIRHRILPGLEATFIPGISDILRRLGRTAGRLSSAEENFLDVIMPGADIGGSGFVERDLVAGLPKILQKRVIVDYLVQMLREYPSGSLVDDALEFILAGRNGQLSLRGDMILTLSYGVVDVGRDIAASYCGLPSRGLELKIPGSLAIPSAGMAITAKLSAHAASGSYPSGKTALLSRKRVTGSLWVRKRLSGDRFMPLGMDRHKKLKDFLVDRKIPRADRDRIPIVLDEHGDIVWVGGVEISQKAALDGVEGEEAILIRIEDL